MTFVEFCRTSMPPRPRRRYGHVGGVIGEGMTVSARDPATQIAARQWFIDHERRLPQFHGPISFAGWVARNLASPAMRKAAERIWCDFERARRAGVINKHKRAGARR